MPKHNGQTGALRVSLVYAIVAGLWIIFSDRLVAALVIDSTQLTWWQTYKGWGFVLGTAILLYLERRQAEKTLRQSQIRLNRDTSARQKAEQALRESEVRFQTLVDSMDDIIFTLDRQQRHTGVYGRWLARTGLAPDFFLGKTSAEVLGPEAAPIHEEANARALAGEWVVYEWSNENPDGSKAYTQTSLSPIRDEQGQVIGIVGVGRDITPYVETAAALRTSQEQLRSILDTIPDTISRVDRAGCILFVNRTGPNLTVDEVQGTHISDWIPEAAMLTSFRQTMAEVFDTGEVRTFEGSRIETTGRRNWSLFRMGPVWEGEKVVAVTIVTTDITERHILEEQLRQSQKMEAIGRLAGGVAHDFNNILTVISGHSALLLQKMADQAQFPVHHLQEIADAGERAAALTRQLLAFSRQQVLQPRILNLNDVVKSLEKMLRRLIGEDIKLVVAPADELGLVKADLGQLEQVILNLAVNARDAMPHGGKLTIETENVYLDHDYARSHDEVEAGPYVMLAVSDTGMGMDAATRNRIFEPFFTTKKLGKGTGLGLATVHGIVKQSGGYIWLYSELGEGTTFKIYLRQVDYQVPPTAEVGRSLMMAVKGTETILLVEDAEMVRRLAGDILTVNGYTVLRAEDGATAIQIYHRHPEIIDLLLTDVVLPGGMSGPQLAEELTTVRPQLKILYMSGYTSNAIVHRGVLDPGVNLLQKPFTPEALARKVREVLDM